MPEKLSTEELQLQSNYRLMEKLSSSQARLEFVVGSLKEVVFQIGVAGEWTFLNPAWEELTDYSVEESLGRKFLEYIHTEDVGRVIQYFKSLLSEMEENCCYEVRFIKKDGNFRWVKANMRLTKSTPFAVSGIAGTLTDITEQVATKKSLERRDRILEAVAFSAESFLKEQKYNITIPKVMESLGKATGVSRVYLYRNEDIDDDIVLSRFFEWASDKEYQRGREKLRNISFLDYGLEKWKKHFLKNKVVKGRVGDFSRRERFLLEAQKIKSIALLPVFAGSHWWGMIGFDDCERDVEWSDAELHALKTAASTFGASLVRHDVSLRLKESSERFATLVNHLPSGLLMEDDSFTILHANPMLCELFNIQVSPDKLIGTNCSDAMDELSHIFVDPKSFKETIKKRLELPDVITGEKIELRDGRVFERDYVPVVLPDNKINHIWNYRDVTSRMMLERWLETRTEELNGILSLSPAGFVVLDDSQDVTFVNLAFSKMTGLSIGMLVGGNVKSIADKFLSICDKSKEQLGLFEKSDGDSALFHITKPEPRVLKRSLYNIINRDGEYSGDVVCLQDMTSEYQLDRMKSEFLATAAHELRTPLASVCGFSELLLLEDSPFSAEERKDMLESIQRQSGVLASLVDELLDLARIDDGRGRGFKIEMADLNKLVSDAVKEYAMAEKSHDFELCLAKGQPAVEVDQEKFMQVMSNLLSNASKYSEAGTKIKISTVVTSKSCAISVADHGIGMTHEEVKQVFHRFYRADQSGSIPGVGLGMSLVKEIVDIMGGRVAVESQKGEGTKVFVSFPIKKDAKNEC